VYPTELWIRCAERCVVEVEGLTNNDVKLAKKITRDGKNYFLGDSGNVCTKLAHTKYYAIYFEQPCHGIKFSPSGRLPLVCSADIIIIVAITMVC